MNRQVVWTDHAMADIRRLDQRVAQRVFAAMDRFATTGHGDVKRLKGNTDEWRLRVGDWRVRFTVESVTGDVTVLHVLPRGRAYRP